MEKANEATMAAQDNSNKTKRDFRNLTMYFKEEDLMGLTDDEFEILRTKLKNPSIFGGNAFFHDFHDGPDAKGLKGDKTTLNIYKRLMAAHYSYLPCIDRYSRVFSFCHELGITNLYDIGCGNALQSFLLINAPEMNYTGIDSNIFHEYFDDFVADPAYINELFVSFTGSDRIKYIKETYPFDLEVAKNNVAISIFCGAIRNATATLSRDFERVLLTISTRECNLTGMDIKDVIYNDVERWRDTFESSYDFWKKAMPEFEFYQIGEKGFVFGTKIAADREKLEKRYTIIGDQVLAKVIGTSWHSNFIK